MLGAFQSADLSPGEWLTTGDLALILRSAYDPAVAGALECQGDRPDRGRPTGRRVSRRPPAGRGPDHRARRPARSGGCGGSRPRDSLRQHCQWVDLYERPWNDHPVPRFCHAPLAANLGSGRAVRTPICRIASRDAGRSRESRPPTREVPQIGSDSPDYRLWDEDEWLVVGLHVANTGAGIRGWLRRCGDDRQRG